MMHHLYRDGAMTPQLNVRATVALSYNGIFFCCGEAKNVLKKEVVTTTLLFILFIIINKVLRNKNENRLIC